MGLWISCVYKWKFLVNMSGWVAAQYLFGCHSHDDSIGKDSCYRLERKERTLGKSRILSKTID